TPVGQSPRKDSGPPCQNIKCYCCGKEGHYANECNQKDTTSKDSKTGKARLFAAEVIEDDNANTTPETQEAEVPSHNEGDHEMLAEEEADANDKVIDIYGEYYDSDDDGEPIAYLGSMDAHNFDDEQICYARMDVEESTVEGDPTKEDEPDDEEASSGKNETEEVMANPWGIVNTIENEAMPPRADDHAWHYSERFGLTHVDDCQTCRIHRAHIIRDELAEVPSLIAARVVPHQLRRRSYDEGWDAREEAAGEALAPHVGYVLAEMNAAKNIINLALEHLGGVMDGSWPTVSVDRMHQTLLSLGRLVVRTCQAIHPRENDASTSALPSSRQMRTARTDIDRTGELLQGIWGAMTRNERLSRARESLSGEPHLYVDVETPAIPDRPTASGPPCPSSDETRRLMALHPTEETTRTFRYGMCTNSTITPRPTVPPQARACVIVKAQVNGCEALTMIDTGSTTNFMSPAFTTVAKLPTFTLASQLTLQLGCVGSHSKITHGSQTKLRLGAFTCDTYFDVANIDQYDCILGIPFLRSHGVRLKFDTNTIEVGGISVPAHTELDLSSSVENRP
ncbi:hypothetical protein PISMIDRAFT_17127, partial [Pisolithus microcarpus 441]